MSAPRAAVATSKAASLFLGTTLRSASRSRPPPTVRCHPQRQQRFQSTQPSRHIHQQTPWNASAATATAPAVQPPEPTNPPLSFPCLDASEQRSAHLYRRSAETGPEPSYTVGEHLTFYSQEPLLLDWGGLLPEFSIAYETWGTLNSVCHIGLGIAKGEQSNMNLDRLRLFLVPGMIS